MMGSVSNSLKVDIEELSKLGEYLLKSDFNDNFDKLDKEMSKITGSWLDLEGDHFKEVFQSFVTDAKKISDCVEDLGDFAKGMSTKYKETLDDHTSEMKKIVESIG